MGNYYGVFQANVRMFKDFGCFLRILDVSFRPNFFFQEGLGKGELFWNFGKLYTPAYREDRSSHDILIEERD